MTSLTVFKFCAAIAIMANFGMVVFARTRADGERLEMSILRIINFIPYGELDHKLNTIDCFCEPRVRDLGLDLDSVTHLVLLEHSNEVTGHMAILTGVDVNAGRTGG